MSLKKVINKGQILSILTFLVKQCFKLYCHNQELEQSSQLIMIRKILATSPLVKALASSTRHANFFSTTAAIKILRQADSITQNDIDSILGIEPNEKQSKELQNPYLQQNNVISRQLFYNLVPLKNQNFPVCIDPEEAVILQTPNQNIMNVLQITVQNSYNDYCNRLQKFWKEDQLYGSITPQNKILPENLQFKQLLTTDSKYLQRLRKNFMVNLSMPGSIQAEDPRNFMELRPVQQFRNTPIIPISQSAMKRHKQKLEEYHRKQFVLQISNESVLNFLLFATAAGICGYMIYLILEKEEERTVAYTRLKYNRKKGIQQTPTFKI